VASDIFDTAGIVVEPDMQVEAAEEETTVETPAQEEDQKKRLSVFEDFLQNLDSGDQDDRPGEDPQVPDPPESPDEPK
jgi:hypothetical protein